MATKARIEFDFKKALKQASELERIADRIGTISRKNMQDTLQNVSGGWKGENAEIYLKKGEQLSEKIYTTADDLRQTAADIKAIAKKIYEAEMRALSIAKKRDY